MGSRTTTNRSEVSQPVADQAGDRPARRSTRSAKRQKVSPHSESEHLVDSKPSASCDARDPPTPSDDGSTTAPALGRQRLTRGSSDGLDARLSATDCSMVDELAKTDTSLQDTKDDLDAEKPPPKKARVVLKQLPSPSARKSRSKWDNPDEMLTNSRSPLATAKLRDLLCSPRAWDALSESEKKQVLQEFPDHSGILEPLTPNARPDIATLRNNDNFRHDVARYQEDLSGGRHDPEWISQAEAAHRKRELGVYNDYLAAKFEEEWGMKVPNLGNHTSTDDGVGNSATDENAGCDISGGTPNQKVDTIVPESADSEQNIVVRNHVTEKQTGVLREGVVNEETSREEISSHDPAIIESSEPDNSLNQPKITTPTNRNLSSHDPTPNSSRHIFNNGTGYHGDANDFPNFNSANDPEEEPGATKSLLNDHAIPAHPKDVL